MEFLGTYKKQIQQLCVNHKVKSLYSFGSVNTNKFHEQSDIDLLVEFSISDPIEYSDNYFDLKFELEKVLNRTIDLLENKAIKNPFLRSSIDKSKELVYAR